MELPRPGRETQEEEICVLRLVFVSWFSWWRLASRSNPTLDIVWVRGLLVLAGVVGLPQHLLLEWHATVTVTLTVDQSEGICDICYVWQRM
jgi:hypothetical protein